MFSAELPAFATYRYGPISFLRAADTLETRLYESFPRIRRPSDAPVQRVTSGRERTG